MKEFYTAQGLPWTDYPEMTGFLRSKGFAGLNPFVTEAEHRELFESLDPTRVVELLLIGMGRLAAGTSA